MFWKYAVNLQEDTHAEVWLLFSSRFGAYLRTPFYKNTYGELLLQILLIFLSMQDDWKQIHVYKY